MSKGDENVFPPALPREQLFEITDGYGIGTGLTKRELFAAIAMHAEFLSCGSNEQAAHDLAEAAHLNGQSVEQRIAINALSVADATLAELAK